MLVSSSTIIRVNRGTWLKDHMYNHEDWSFEGALKEEGQLASAVKAQIIEGRLNAHYCEV